VVRPDLDVPASALDDAPDALAQFNARQVRLRPEAGNSLRRTSTIGLRPCGDLGHVDRHVTADTPLYAVFRKGDAALRDFQPAGSARPSGLTVRFSDGQRLAADKPGFHLHAATVSKP